MKERKDSYASKHTVNNSFMVIVQNVFVCVCFTVCVYSMCVFVFFPSKEHFSKQNVLQLTKEEENLSKSQYRYRSIIK